MPYRSAQIELSCYPTPYDNDTNYVKRGPADAYYIRRRFICVDGKDIDKNDKDANYVERGAVDGRWFITSAVVRSRIAIPKT